MVSFSQIPKIKFDFTTVAILLSINEHRCSLKQHRTPKPWARDSALVGLGA